MALLSKARVLVFPVSFRGSSLWFEFPLGQVLRKVSRPATQVGLKENRGANELWSMQESIAQSHVRAGWVQCVWAVADPGESKYLRLEARRDTCL